MRSVRIRTVDGSVRVISAGVSYSVLEVAKLACSRIYGGPVGRGYEQRFESKNEYEQRSESKIAYGPRAKLRTVREQNCVRSESKIAYGLRAKLRTVREQKRAGAESKNAYELRAVVYIGFRHYAICFFSLKKWLPDATLASSVCNFPKGC